MRPPASTLLNSGISGGGVLFRAGFLATTTTEGGFPLPPLPGGPLSSSVRQFRRKEEGDERRKEGEREEEREEE